MAPGTRYTVTKKKQAAQLKRQVVQCSHRSRFSSIDAAASSLLPLSQLPCGLARLVCKQASRHVVPQLKCALHPRRLRFKLTGQRQVNERACCIALPASLVSLQLAVIPEGIQDKGK